MLFDILLKYSICCERTTPSIDVAAYTLRLFCVLGHSSSSGSSMFPSSIFLTLDVSLFPFALHDLLPMFAHSNQPLLMFLRLKSLDA